MVSLDDARKIMMGVEQKPADVSWDEVHAIIQGTYEAQIKASMDAQPPIEPPFAKPPRLPNSNMLGGVNNVDPGIFTQELYIIFSNYDADVYQLNDKNDKADASYRGSYASWRAKVVGEGIVTLLDGSLNYPPLPSPYRVMMSLSDYVLWYRGLEQGKYQTLPDPPIEWAIPQKLSNFDFEAYLKNRADLTIHTLPNGVRESNQVKSQPVIGDLLRAS